jgi:hypothetical protein
MRIKQIFTNLTDLILALPQLSSRHGYSLQLLIQSADMSSPPAAIEWADVGSGKLNTRDAEINSA